MCRAARAEANEEEEEKEEEDEEDDDTVARVLECTVAGTRSPLR